MSACWVCFGLDTVAFYPSCFPFAPLSNGIPGIVLLSWWDDAALLLYLRPLAYRWSICVRVVHVCVCVAGSCVKFLLGSLSHCRWRLVRPFARNRSYISLWNPSSSPLSHVSYNVLIARQFLITYHAKVSSLVPFCFRLSYRNSLTLRWLVVSSVIAFLPPMTSSLFYAKYLLPMEYLVVLYIFIASRADIRHIIFECVVLFLSPLCVRLIRRYVWRPADFVLGIIFAQNQYTCLDYSATGSALCLCCRRYCV